MDEFEEIDKKLNEIYMQLINSKDNPKDFEENLANLAKTYYACKNYLYSTRRDEEVTVRFMYCDIGKVESILAEFGYIDSPQNKFSL